MKYFNNKIANFVEWCEENNYPLPSTSLYDQYMLENENVEPLTEKEIKYLKILYRNKIELLGINGGVKTDIVKILLSYECGVSEKAVRKNDNPDYVSFDFSGLLTENVSDVNHKNETFENTAVYGDTIKEDDKWGMNDN